MPVPNEIILPTQDGFLLKAVAIRDCVPDLRVSFQFCDPFHFLLSEV